jgi:predicted nucleotidyltransferase
LGTIVPVLGTRRRKRRAAGPRPQGLADALFSKTQQRVLGLLFGQPDRSFFTKEIIRAASSGAGAAQRELARLEKSGIVRASRVGNQKHYQANRSNPLFNELRAVVLKTFGIAEPLREALKPLSDRIALALVYGSVAKGDDRGASDIDLLVVARDVTLGQLFSLLAPAEKALGRRISPTLYTPDEFRRRRHTRNAFLENVMRGKTLPLIGSVDDLAISG